MTDLEKYKFQEIPINADYKEIGAINKHNHNTVLEIYDLILENLGTQTLQKSEYICSDCGSIIVKRSEFVGIRNQTRAIINPLISAKEKTNFELEIGYIKTKKSVYFETKEDLKDALKSFMANL